VYMCVYFLIFHFFKIQKLKKNRKLKDINFEKKSKNQEFFKIEQI
jgi:hypothetical protein